MRIRVGWAPWASRATARWMSSGDSAGGAITTRSAWRATTTHSTLGKRGNNPFCYHRTKVLKLKQAERLVQVERAEGPTTLGALKSSKKRGSNRRLGS